MTTPDSNSFGDKPPKSSSSIELLKNKKIIGYPIGLGANEADMYGDENQYIMINIHTDEKATKLRGDVALNKVVSSTKQGTGVATGNSVPQMDTDKPIMFGPENVDKEKYYEQKGMVKLNRVVILPMPNDHLVKTSVSYNDVDQTFLTKAGDMVNQGFGDLISDAASYYKNAGLAAIVNKMRADSTSLNALLAEERRAMNPKQEVMFNSFRFRSFQFNFQFAPKSKEEALMVQEIIETLRYYALPEISKSKLFYLFPAEFEIYFMRGQKPNSKIPRIATSVLRTVDVNYSPNGVWATLPDGSPVALTMSLDFYELEMIDRNRVYNADSPVTSGY